MKILVAVFALAMVGLAEDHPLPKPETLKAQSEAQERERAINRNRDLAAEKVKAASVKTPAAPKKEEVLSASVR